MHGTGTCIGPGILLALAEVDSAILLDEAARHLCLLAHHGAKRVTHPRVLSVHSSTYYLFVHLPKMHRPSWMRTKGNSKPNPKASSIAVPSRSNLANEAEAGLGNHPEVYDPPVLNAVNSG